MDLRGDRKRTPDDPGHDPPHGRTWDPTWCNSSTRDPAPRPAMPPTMAILPCPGRGCRRLSTDSSRPTWPRRGQSILRWPCPAKGLRRRLTFRTSRFGIPVSIRCPLYSFLYHEYANGFQGFYTNRVNDEALRAFGGKGFGHGYFINFTLRDKGLVEYDWDQTWNRAVPDQAAFIDWTKRAQPFPSGSGPRLSRLRAHAAALESQRSHAARLRMGSGTSRAIRHLASAGRTSGSRVGELR